MWLVLAPFLAGLLLGWRGELSGAHTRAACGLVTGGVALVLFILGARLGTDPALLRHLRVLGGEAAVFALLTVSGSVLAVWLLRGQVERA